MIVEHVTFERNKILVSYTTDDLSLMTPEMEARLHEFWTGLIERMMAGTLGAGTSRGNALAQADVPEREHESPKRPICTFMIPSGNS